MTLAIIIKKPRAEQDLLDHYLYIGKDNLQAAERFLKAAEKALFLLAKFPNMGQSWDFESPRLTAIRSWPIPKFKNYLVFYRPVDDGIEVLHVLHAKRDIRTILESEEPDE